MAEYINRDELFKHYRALANIEWNKTVAPISWCDAYEEIADHIAELPPADVVPKSEVEEIVRQWKEEANCWQNNYITELRANEQIRAEVSREIFEEIDEIMANIEIYVSDRERTNFEIGAYKCHASISLKIAELKKKYTGD